MERFGNTVVALAATVAVGVIAACSPNGSESSVTTAASTTTVEAVTDATITLETTPQIETTGTAEEQFDWYLNVLNGTAEFDERSFQQRFSPGLREQLPFREFTGLTNQLSTVAPVAVASSVAVPAVDIDPESGVVDAVEVALAANNGAGVLVTLGVDSDGLIAQIDMEIDDDPTLTTDPADLPQAASDVNGYGEFQWVAADLNIDASRLGDVTCTPTEGDRLDVPGGVGTTSAIWVLGALADAIAAGDLTWDTELTVTDAGKSLDPGVLNERPDGSPVSVRNAATFMFELSDNTAFDLLVEALGRERIEAAQTRWGNTHPELNTPFLTTREMFVLKTSTEDVQERYLAADPATRRQMLPELSSVSADQIPVDVFLQGPIRPSELNWFASPVDVCTGLGRLMWTGTNRDGLGEIVDIITSNHGGTPDAQWDQIAYKGGTEPGMLTMAWVMQAEVELVDGETVEEWYGYVGNVVNPDEAFSDAEPPLLLAAGRDLMGPPLDDEGAEEEAKDEDESDQADESDGS